MGAPFCKRTVFASVVLLGAIMIAGPDALLAKSGSSGSTSGHSSGKSSGKSSSKSTGKSSGKSSGSSSKSIKSGTHHGGEKKAAGVKRDKEGKIARSEKSKEDFMKKTGYPHGRPGYVVDHIKPLKEGGKDDPSNMQWQTKQDAKAKDKWE